MDRGEHIWLHSQYTGYWFLFDVGFVVKVGDQWVARLKNKRFRPRERTFNSRAKAMAWVEEKA